MEHQPGCPRLEAWDHGEWDAPCTCLDEDDNTYAIVREIYYERQRQIANEGFTYEHDNAHHRGDLARAASVYAREAFSSSFGTVPYGWPWDSRFYKHKAPRENLIRAAALIVAEIERLDREEAGDE